MNDKYYVGRKAKSVTIGTKLPPVSKVVLTSASDAVYEAGDDSGYIFEIYVPTATQAMADNILKQIGGFEYQGFSATNAFLPPDVELGDGITTHGVYGMLASQEYSFTPKMTETVSSPYATETDHEYDYQGTYEKQIADRVKLGHLYYGTRISRKNGLEIVKTDGNTELSRVILNSDLLAFYDDNGNQVLYFDPVKHTFVITHYADVEDAIEGSRAYSKLEFSDKQLQVQIGDAKGNISSLQQTAKSLQSQISSNDGDISSLKQTANSLSIQIYNTKGDISTLEQKVDSFKLSVSNGYDSSTITLKAGNTSISSATIDMTGVVTFKGLSSGTTTIDGSCIKTGFINSNRLNLTGSITFRDLAYDVQDEIEGAYDVAWDAMDVAEDVDYMIRGWTYPGTTEIDGASIRTGTVTASVLEGGVISLINGWGDHSGVISLSGAQTARYAVDLLSYGALRLLASSGTLYLESGWGTHISMDMDIGINCNLNVYGDVYSRGSILTSDLTKKKDIHYGIEEYDLFFDLLKPISFKFVDDDADILHIGLGAQDVEKALKDSGFLNDQFAGLVVNSDSGYALRYSEFVPLLISQVQALKTRVSYLERRLS